MAVYIDDMNRPYGRMIMCHMIADSTSELKEMALYLGLKPEWIQNPGEYQEHFDVSKSAKQKAIAKGAIAVTQRELVAMLVKRKS